MKFMGAGAGKIWKLKNNQKIFKKRLKTLDIHKIGGIMNTENQKEVINDDEERKTNPVRSH